MVRVFVVACCLMASLVWGWSPGPCDAAESVTVGFGLADITPRVEGGKPVFIAGYGQNRRATGVHDPLFARAIVLSDGHKRVALAAVDVVGLQYPTVQEIRKRLSGFDYVLVASTHNHEGPDTVGIWGPSPIQSGVNPQYMEHLIAQTVAAIQAADKDRAPATTRYGTAADERLLRDSREPWVKDDVIRVVRFDAEGTSKPRCLLVNWTCHPEALASRNKLITADFPHYVIHELEQKYGCPVLYFSGAVGGLMAPPRDLYKQSDGSPLADGSFEFAERYGKDVAELAGKALDAAEPAPLAPIRFAGRPIGVPLASPLYRVARMMGMLKREGRKWTGDFDQLGEVIMRDDPNQTPAGVTEDAPLEPAVVDILPGKKFLLVGLANDELGYIVPKRQWDEKPPFAYGRKEAQYGEGNSCGPEMAPILLEALKRRVADVAHSPSAQ